MVVLNRIYTRTGDDGTTALGSGARRKKYDLRVDAYGTLDEVNAVIGIVRLHVGEEPALDGMLARIQNDLFDVEADLCLSEKGPPTHRWTGWSSASMSSTPILRHYAPSFCRVEARLPRIFTLPARCAAVPSG